ncbi:MAG: cytochrome c [Tenuifilaceae bacterium]
MQIRKYIFCVILMLATTANTFAQTSPIPIEAKNRTAPFLFTSETVKSGEQIYNTFCKSCHGDPGKANYAKLDPIPKDPASLDYQKNTDGEMFYILSHGKGLMPNFVNSLNEEQRWDVIAFVRSLNKDYKQPPIKAGGDAVKTETAKMILAFDQTSKKLFATVTDSLTGVKKPLANVSIKLFVKRTFGNLPISKTETNESGIAYFEIPNDIPGDSQGNLSFIARTEGNSKELISTIDEKLGVITESKQLLDQRTWWNVNKMAPIWLIILYLSGITGVGITVLYILLQLRKIRKLNQTK